MPETAQQGFGKYVLVSKLAAGGMAVTYRARLTAAAGVTKTVVIKKILPHYADNPEFVQMFITEAKLAASLSHGNIAQVFDFGELGGEYFLAMEYVHGQPLSRVLHRAFRNSMPHLPTPIALHVAQKMSEGLHYAHTRVDENGRPLGIVHRDVSPDNVLVGYEGEVKLVDFGIAKTVAMTRVRTEPGTLKGKYPYFSPEQAKGATDIDHRTDVFATGVVLYEMLCGRRPHEGDFLQVLPKIVKGDFPRPSELNPDVTPELEEIILTAMARRREDRYQSAQELAQALSAYLYGCAPDWSPDALAKLMEVLFEKELTSEGRRVTTDPGFVESLKSWRQDSRPGRRRGTTGTKLRPLEELPHDTPREVPAVEHPAMVPTRQALKPAPIAAIDPAEAAQKGRRLAFMLSIPIFGLAALLLVLYGLFKNRGDGEAVPTQSIWVTSTPAGADVVVDEQPYGKTPVIVPNLPMDVPHTVALALTGMRPWTKRLSPSRELKITVHAEMEPALPEPEPVAEPQRPPEPERPKKNDFGEAEYPVRMFILRPMYNAAPLPEYNTASIELDPGSAYSVWTEGAISVGPGATSGTVMYFLEGNVPAASSFGFVGSAPKVVKGGKRFHAFVLDDDVEDNKGSLRINFRVSKYVPVKVLPFDAKENAVVLKPEHRFVLTQLNPASEYLLTIRDDFAEVQAGPAGRIGRTLCVLHGESPRPVPRTHVIFQAGKRATVTGATRLECTFPDERTGDNQGALEIDLVDVTNTTRRRKGG